MLNTAHASTTSKLPRVRKGLAAFASHWVRGRGVGRGHPLVGIDLPCLGASHYDSFQPYSEARRSLLRFCGNAIATHTKSCPLVARPSRSQLQHRNLQRRDSPSAPPHWAWHAWQLEALHRGISQQTAVNSGEDPRAACSLFVLPTAPLHTNSPSIHVAKLPHNRRRIPACRIP